MALVPRFKSFLATDYPGAEPWFVAFLDKLDETLRGLVEALQGRLDKTNLVRQVSTLTFTTQNPVDGLFAVTQIARAANVDTATTAVAHGLVTGNTIEMAAVGAPNANFSPGTYVVTGTPTTTTFTYAETKANIGATTVTYLEKRSIPESSTFPLYVPNTLPVRPYEVRVGQITCPTLDITEAVTVVWDLTQDGLIRIQRVTGLDVSTQYALTLVIEG